MLPEVRSHAEQIDQLVPTINKSRRLPDLAVAEGKFLSSPM